MRSCLLVAALLVLAPVSAHADYEETERRLKAVNIDAPLRARIHAAIDRAVAHLVERQGRRGSWVPQQPGERRYRVGVTALCGLALRHAGTPEARKGARKAIRFILGPGGQGRREILRTTYMAGIAAMLFMAEGGPGEVGRAIGRRIGESQFPRSRWWGYVITDKKTRSTTGVAADRANLSTTQFAALGMWAGARLGERIPSRVWRHHLESLVRDQVADGSWCYFPRERKPGGYPTGTFMGLANLLLAEDALKEHLRLVPAFQKRVLATRLRGLAALRRDGRRVLEQLDAARGQGVAPSSTPPPSYYTLYALEKACIFAGVERLGDVPWYRTGAEELVGLQREDGGWGVVQVPGEGRGGWKHRQSHLISTAFGLLFLLRSSEVYRPTKPAPVDLKRPKDAVVTPSR